MTKIPDGIVVNSGYHELLKYLTSSGLCATHCCSSLLTSGSSAPPIREMLRPLFETSWREIRYVGEKYAKNGLRLPSRGSGGQVKFGDLSAAPTKSAING